ncbi:hypothetical protein RUND412_008996 [Rhizina undulata]
MSSKTSTEIEAQILTSFLLSRASLSDMLPLRNFAELFPKASRSNPQIKLLYRELQLQRTRVCELVRRNVQHEAKIGQRQRREARREMRKEAEGMEEGVGDGFELFAGAGTKEPKMSLKETIAVLEQTIEDLEEEFQGLDQECKNMAEFMKYTIGDLSDLRYGKFATPGTDEQTVGQLENLYGICERVLIGADGDKMEME